LWITIIKITKTKCNNTPLVSICHGQSQRKSPYICITKALSTIKAQLTTGLIPGLFNDFNSFIQQHFIQFIDIQIFTMRITSFFLISLFLTVLAACDSKPKAIEAESSSTGTKGPIFQDGQTAPTGQATSNAPTPSGEDHKVTVAEILNTDKYSYLRVKENGEEYWIAIGKRDVKVGKSYLYAGGIMKKNFQSREFNRTFETVYLVSDFRDEDAPAGAMPMQGGGIPSSKEALEPPKNLKPAPGAIKISELVANLKKYDGKTIKVTGKCVKLNPMIMGKNWLHLQDGSGKNMDLTVTTTENVALGDIITMEGTIALNRDFGAGYKYDYIMETAVVAK
jgi:hypothetical protein